jgi:hypothetical protein
MGKKWNYNSSINQSVRESKYRYRYTGMNMEGEKTTKNWQLENNLTFMAQYLVKQEKWISDLNSKSNIIHSWEYEEEVEVEFFIPNGRSVVRTRQLQAV